MRRLPFTLAALLALAPVLAAAPPPDEPPDVRRVLRTFDFEERRLGNAEDLPMHWEKVAGPGLPHYVNGRLSADLARSGRYAFRFDLNGGGLVYRYAPGHIPAAQGAHYRVEVWCRTTVLPAARARLTAYLTDVDGHTLPETVRHSDLYAAAANDEPWRRLAVELSAETPKAAWLVMELGLLQPQQYAAATLGQRTLNVQDIRGTAWFDDVTVSQVPRVKMTTDRPGNVFRRGDPPRLRVRVDDRSTDDLAAQLVVRGADGKAVYQRSGAIDVAAAKDAGPGRKLMALDLPALPAGWYEASLVMSSEGRYLGAQTLAFVQLADDGAPARPDGRFGFVATSLPFAGWGQLPDVLPLLAAGRVKLALWSGAGDIQEMDPAAFDALLTHLGDRGITPTACLLDLPPSLAARIDAASADPATGERPPAGATRWPLLLKADPKEWQPQLAFLVSRHANHLDRWQLGADGTDAFVTDPKMRQAYAAVYREFGKLVQSPDLAMPWPAWYEMEGELPATVALSVPPAVVLPSQLPLYVQDVSGGDAARKAAAMAGGHNLSLSLDWLDPARYGRAVQLRDIAQRLVYALSADARRIDLPLPLAARPDPSGDDGIITEPQEVLLVLRTVITALGGATYKGKVPIGENVEAFLFDRNGEGVMAVWDRGGATGERELDLNLGDRPVMIDLWGNATPLLKRAGAGKDGRPGEVKLTLGPMPVFLVDIDGQLAQTRASVALDRPLIESSFQPHTRHVRFTNAYRQAVGGTLRLRPPAGWTINPPTFQFTLNPGETFDREITIEIPYNGVAGPKTISADLTIQGERNARFTVPITAGLGLSDVGMQTLALRDGRDVVVQQMVTNYGDKPINYDAFAICPGQARQERAVTNLAPGATTLKRYRFTALAVPAGAKIRVGLKEQAGSRILNDEVAVQ